MKIYCDHCRQDLKSKVREPFDKYQTGRLICPYCHKENKRYLSEFDLLLYFLLSAAAYSGGVTAVMYILDFLNTKYLWPAVAALILLLISCYLFIDNLAKYIYLHAPAKQSWKDQTFKEDSALITKLLNQQFLVYIIVSIFIGLQRDMYLYYLVFVSILLIYNLLKTIYVYRREKRLENRL